MIPGTPHIKDTIAPALKGPVATVLAWGSAILCLGAVLLVFSGFFLIGSCEGSALKEAQAEIKTLANVVDTYSTLNQRKFPDTLEQLTQGPAPLIKKIPKDPWGNEYVYNKTAPREFMILSAGIDGQIFTEDDVKAAE